ncbi:ribonuclease P protein component [Gluconacetobacter entanii]|uniref:Ribonuclease P protein component n=1 Tax=Gluconacetobacter entanii TaxID=108528 RepID=A0A318PTW5_9PROT|nr:ribonuclease P protein component [Gluconacetobacter entanii]MBE7620108.1 ribonuclease P protein component [Komagataeibacter sp. FXV2]MCE2579878.1 ribonuclease P protein component [Komagataeibacter sp. FNDCR1]MBY4639406.1 ribonuclease P protein component [Gluconacetobacter entanii]MCW4582082.1 ribonuclease P protein component [Gluconacetobacter entanii]MCW4585559.1 ribonuclease P protein component [Gluconacetobacter entanii]
MADRSIRLKKRAEFLKVAAKGRKAPVSGMVVQALHRDDDDSARHGFTVTKKVGNSVVRNRVRRRLREVVRQVGRELPLSGVDLVVIGRSATIDRKFAALLTDYRKALKKAGVVGDA